MLYVFFLASMTTYYINNNLNCFNQKPGDYDIIGNSFIPSSKINMTDFCLRSNCSDFCLKKNILSNSKVSYNDFSFFRYRTINQQEICDSCYNSHDPNPTYSLHILCEFKFEFDL